MRRQHCIRRKQRRLYKNWSDWAQLQDWVMLPATPQMFITLRRALQVQWVTPTLACWLPHHWVHKADCLNSQKHQYLSAHSGCKKCCSFYILLDMHASFPAGMGTLSATWTLSTKHVAILVWPHSQYQLIKFLCLSLPLQWQYHLCHQPPLLHCP